MSGRRLALVVATDRYEDTTLRGLAAPSADAEALAGVLGDPDLGGFEVDVLLNPTSWVAAEHVEGLLGERHPSDLVLLHFSCHGLKDESGELFLAARNTKPTLLASTALDAALVNRLMRRSRAHRVVLLLDCCYGGAFERGVVVRADENMHVGGHFAQDQLGGGRGRVVITASSAMEYALEGTDVTLSGRPKPSVFTGALVEGLNTGEADRDQDGHVGLDELYDYVFDKVQSRSPHQTPSRWEFGLQGDLYIARNPRRRVVPAPVSDEILQLAHHVAPGVRLGAVDELAQLSGGPNLQLAAGAAMVLRQLANDDSRRVAEAAATTLARLGPKVDAAEIALGAIPLGSTFVTEVPVRGSPLALASSVETSGPPVSARLDRSMLRVDVTGSAAGPLQGWVTLTSAIGEARIDVGAEVVSTVEPEPPAGATSGVPSAVAPILATPALVGPVEPRNVSGPALAPREPIRTSTERGLPLVVALLALGAAALVAAQVLTPDPPDPYGGLFAGPKSYSWWTLVPVGVIASTIPALFLTRAHAVALGTVAGSAAWAGVYCVRQLVSNLTTTATLGETADAWLGTGAWARLLAFLLLAGATSLLLRVSPGALTRPVLPWDGRSTVAATLVVCGASAPLLRGLVVETQDLPGTATVSIAVVVLCLPVAISRLADHQRAAALAFTTTFLLLVWGRVLLVAITAPSFVRSPSAVTAFGFLAVLAGCYLGGARRAVKSASMS